MTMPISENKYRAIVFDNGGVLEFFGGNNPIETAAGVLGVPVEDFLKEYFKHNHMTNAENIPWNEMFSNVLSVFGATAEIKKNILSMTDSDRSKSSINGELISKLPSLKEQGYLLAVFSNDTTSLRDSLNEKGLTKYFDELVISGEIGFQKPSKEAFNILFSKLGVEPSEVVFIDDSPKSLEGADKIGYTPICFKNNDQLMSDLLNIGIQI